MVGVQKMTDDKNKERLNEKVNSLLMCLWAIEPLYDLLSYMSKNDVVPDEVIDCMRYIRQKARQEEVSEMVRKIKEYNAIMDAMERLRTVMK